MAGKVTVLAFDTSSSTCSIALQHGDNVRLCHELLPMQQAQSILALIENLLLEEKIEINQLDVIAYGCGPGSSFTGIRIATSVAQGLGLALNKPLIPISSLTALAQTAYMEYGWEKICVAIDARTDQIYFAYYQVHSGEVSLIDEEKAIAIREFCPLEGDWYAVGDGWIKYKKALELRFEMFPKSKLNIINSSLYPSAHAILKLMQKKFAKREWVQANAAFPCYLR